MKDREKIIEAARLIKSLGIELLLDANLAGKFSLEPEEVIEVAEDMDGWIAKQRGMTRDRYVQWRQYREDEGQCTGLTRSGRRCRRRGEYCATPEDFKPGFHDRCPTHKE